MHRPVSTKPLPVRSPIYPLSLILEGRQPTQLLGIPENPEGDHETVNHYGIQDTAVTRKVKWNDGISSGWSWGVNSGYLYSALNCAEGTELPHQMDG